MSDENACETPLVDHLRSIPKDYRGEWPIQWSEGGAETGHSMSPIGLHAHRAADTISQLEAERVELVEGLEWLQSQTRPTERIMDLLAHHKKGLLQSKVVIDIETAECLEIFVDPASRVRETDELKQMKKEAHGVLVAAINRFTPPKGDTP